jgi:hypothetical protein
LDFGERYGKGYVRWGRRRGVGKGYVGRGVWRGVFTLGSGVCRVVGDRRDG